MGRSSDEMKAAIGVFGFLTLCLSSLAMAGIEFTQTITIKASPRKVWEALVNPDLVKGYYLAPLRRIELRKGGEIVYGTADEAMISGCILEVEPPKKLVHTFRFGSGRSSGAEVDPATTVSYRLKGTESETTLTLVHSGFKEKNQSYANISGGWPVILGGLKKMLEAGNQPK